MTLWREIVESLPDGVIVLSPTLELMALNSAAETLLSASHVTRHLTDRLMVHNPWLAGMAAACLSTGQSVETPEASLVLERSARCRWVRQWRHFSAGGASNSAR